MDIQVKIDPDLIPNYVYDQACAVLCTSICRLLSDPALRQEFEAWKKEYAAEQAAKEVVTA